MGISLVATHCATSSANRVATAARAIVNATAMAFAAATRRLYHKHALRQCLWPLLWDHLDVAPSAAFATLPPPICPAANATTVTSGQGDNTPSRLGGGGGAFGEGGAGRCDVRQR